jgi:hypothetical protein
MSSLQTDSMNGLIMINMNGPMLEDFSATRPVDTGIST